MARNLSSILLDANAVLDLEATLPTGDELETRTNYANQAVWDASATGQLSEFKREYLTTTSTLATISLPSDYRELQEWPRILDSSGTWIPFEVVEVDDKYEKNSNDRYCYVLGNPSEGYNLIFNNIIDSATLSVIYQRYPSGLLTLADVCELSDPQYVVKSIERYVLYSRSDDRFPIAKAESEKVLSNMMGREMKNNAGLPRSTKRSFDNPLRNLS